jgi:uncharacterized Fe-S center protein
MPILPDAGVFGSDDIVALDQAILDATAKTPLFEENLPSVYEILNRDGHPFSWFHGPIKDPYKIPAFGEKYGLGSREYELVDVFPVEKFARPQLTYIPAK